MSVLLAWHNKIETATLTSDATFETTLPLINIQNYLLPKVAQTVDDSPFTITATFAANVDVGCVMVANHNLGRVSTLQIKCYDGATLKDDSGIMAVYPKNGFYIIKEEDGFESLRKDYAYFLPSNQSIDKVELIFTPEAADYVRIGRIFIGETFEPVSGVDYGDQQIGYKDLSEIRTVPCGVQYINEQQMLRTVDLTLKYMSENEVFDNIFDAHRRLGLKGEVVYSHTGRQAFVTVPQGLAQTKQFFAQCFICRFVDLNPLTQPFYNGYTNVLKLLEIAT